LLEKNSEKQVQTNIYDRYKRVLIPVKQFMDWSFSHIFMHSKRGM